MIKEKFVVCRRRYPIKDREFRGYMHGVGFEVAEYFMPFTQFSYRIDYNQKLEVFTKGGNE